MCVCVCVCVSVKQLNMHTLYIGNIEKMLPGCLNKQHVNNND